MRHTVTIPLNPMAWNGYAMSREAFHRLPRIVGYKYELIRGQPEISVSQASYCTACVSTAMITKSQLSGKEPTTIDIAAARADHRDALRQLWVETFYGSLDYSGYSRPEIAAHAETRLDDFFSGRNEEHSYAGSSLAFHDDAVVGMALVSKRGPVATLEVLAVRGKWRRRGIASALLRRAGSAASNHGLQRVVTIYHAANAAAESFFHHLQFEVVPDLTLTRLRLRALRTNLEHGHVINARAAQQRLEQLTQQETRLQKQQKTDPIAGSPLLWLEEDPARFMRV